VRLLVSSGWALVSIALLGQPAFAQTKTEAALADDDAKVLALVKDLKSARVADRVKVCEALGALGPVAKSACRDLCQAATETNPRVRKSALFALEKVDKGFFDLSMRLIIEHGVSAANGPDGKEGAEEAFEQAQGLKRNAQDAKPVVPLIYYWWSRHQAERRAEFVREGVIQSVDASANAAIRALRDIVPDEKATARAFTAWLLNDPNPTVRALLAESIPSLKNQKDCVKTLAHSAWHDTDDKVRIASISALRKIAGKDSVKVLVVSAQKDPSDDVRGAAIELLGNLGPAAQAAARVLQELRLDPSPTVRVLASSALKQVTKEP
jgi:HEAT repeat protein